MSDPSLRVIIRAVTDQFVDGMRTANRAVQDLASNVRGQLNSAFNSLRGAIGTLGLGALAKDILDTNRQFETLNASLESVTGSAEKGAAAFARIKQMAAETPFEVEDLTKAYIKLKNFGIEPTDQVMGAITNQVAKLGGGSAELSGITLALGQAFSKGKLQAEEMNQMIERGVPVMELLKQATGKSSAELLDMAQKGQLHRDVIEQLIIKMGELASGSNAKQMETLNGKISNLSDAWHAFENALLGDKSEGLIKKIIGNWTEWINVFADKLSDVDQRLQRLDELNERIATRKLNIKQIQDWGITTPQLEADLAKDIAERDQITQQLHDQNKAAREKKDQDQAASDAIKKQQADAEKLKEQQEATAKWAEKYADKAEKAAIEIKKAKEELGSAFTPELEKQILAHFAEKKPKSAKPQLESDLHGFDRGLQDKQLLAGVNDFSKQDEKAYWDDIIANYKGSAKTLAELKQRSAKLGIDIQKEALKEQKDLHQEAISAEHQAALDELSAKEANAQDALALEDIDQEQYLAKLRQFARERLEIELELLDKKRELLKQDSADYAANLHKKESLLRQFNAKNQTLDAKEKQQQKEKFKSYFQPFEHALDRMVDGVLTGQQSIKKAVANAVQSMVVSYAASFIKAQALSAAHWLWEKLGLATHEASKTGIKAAGETAQTAVTAAGATTRSAIETTANAQSGLKAAFKAAKGAFSSVFDIVPFPFNFILAPLAGAAAFAGTMAFGSAKGGEWQVGENGSPYILHEKESVLPAGVADNFRKVVGIVDQHVAGEPQSLSSVVDNLVKSGAIAGALTLPAMAYGVADQSQGSANRLAKDRIKADRDRAKSGGHGSSDITVNMQGIMLSPDDFFQKHGKTLVNVAAGEARKFNKGKS